MTTHWKLQVRNPLCSTTDLGVMIGWHNNKYAIVQWNSGFRRLEAVHHLQIAGYQPTEPEDDCIAWKDPT